MAKKDWLWKLCRVVFFGIALFLVFLVDLGAVGLGLFYFNRPLTFWEQRDALRNELADWNETNTAVHTWFIVRVVSARGEQAAPLLETLLSDSHRGVRILSAICLGNIGCKSSIYPLRQALEFEEDRLCRERILVSLAQLGDWHVLPALRAEYDGGLSPSYSVVEAFAMLGDFSRVPVVLDDLGKEDESEVYESWWRSYSPDNVLERISGEHFGDDAAKWRAWYEKKIKDNPPPEVPEREIKKWKEIFSRNAEQEADALEKQKGEGQKKD